MTACSSAAVPATQSRGSTNSRSLWLMPPRQGTKIMAAGATDAIGSASWKAPETMPSAGNDNDNKLNKLIANVYRIYQESSDTIYLQPDGTPFDRPGGTQMIFSDLGTQPRKDYIKLLLVERVLEDTCEKAV